MYLYELHCHDNAVSACGHWTPEEMVRFYANRGYTGIVVSNHFMNGSCKVDKTLPWREQIESFCSGYERAKAEGLKYGLEVFFAFEYTCNSFYGQPDAPCRNKDPLFGCDFLIYGLDREWLLSQDESILFLPVNDFLKMVKDAGGTVIHAHPFRLAKSDTDHIPLFPEFTDGVEIINANPNTQGSPNRMAEMYAKEYGFFSTAGSDAHGIERYLAVTKLQERAATIQELLAELKQGKAEFSLVQLP